jgi:uncharacterized membrane protein
MNDKTIVITDALNFGWETLRNNFAFFIKLLGVMIIVAVIPGLILTKLSVLSHGYLSLPLQFLNIIWQAVLGMGALKICLKLYDRQSVEYSDLWSCLPLTLDYVVVKFLYTFIVMIGVILLIVPGMIWSMQFFLASYLVVDRGAGAISALKASSAITNGAKWQLGVFASVVVGINFLGALMLMIGLLITLPITMLASVFVYRTLLAQTEAAGSPLALK